MIWTEQQQDSMVELISIAFGRAAASLSEMTGQRIMLNPPAIALHGIDELREIFENLTHGEVATVHQMFSGSVAGNAILLLDYRDAVTLSNLFFDDVVKPVPSTEVDREVLTEVGNILLNACLGTLGNILQVHISFSVPRMHVSALSALIDSLTIGSEELMYALVVITQFRLKDSAVSGYLVIVLGLSSLECLIKAIEDLG